MNRSLVQVGLGEYLLGMGEFEKFFIVDGVSSVMKPTYNKIQKLPEERARTDLTTGSN